MFQTPHILIVEARFYEDIVDYLVQGAIQALDSVGASYERVSVPGALEIPIAIKLGVMSEEGKKGKFFDAYVALGCVIRGETSHYDIVCNESASGLSFLALEHNLAIGNGILTCDNREQAISRADPDQKNKGGGAVSAALSVLDIKHGFGK